MDKLRFNDINPPEFRIQKNSRFTPAIKIKTMLKIIVLSLLNFLVLVVDSVVQAIVDLWSGRPGSCTVISPNQFVASNS